MNLGNQIINQIKKEFVGARNLRLSASTTMEELVPPGRERCAHISFVMGLTKKFGLDEQTSQKVERCNTLGGVIRTIKNFQKGGNGNSKLA